MNPSRRRSGESSSARNGGTIVTWLHMQKKFSTPSALARLSVNAVDGAVVSKPIAVAGFEPLDVLHAIHMILTQLKEGRCEVENQYARVVPWEGNPRALQVMSEVFELRPHFEWRGMGFISQSGLKLSQAYADFDAEITYSVPGIRVADPKACQCGEVLKGVIKPWECKVFGSGCTPERPIGTCMVSSEGACAAYYNYGRFAREREVV